jgi:hypothetical protein
MARQPKKTKRSQRGRPKSLSPSAIKNGACYENPNGQVRKVLKIENGKVWYIYRGKTPGPGRWVFQSTEQGTRIETFAGSVVKKLKCPPDAAEAAKILRPRMSARKYHDCEIIFVGPKEVTSKRPLGHYVKLPDLKEHGPYGSEREAMDAVDSFMEVVGIEFDTPANSVQ